MSTTTYTQGNPQEIAELFIGRRIVEAEKDLPPSEVPDSIRSYSGYAGRLTLDDGTVLYLAGHDGGCGCSAGCYDLTQLYSVDNIITNAGVESSPSGDDEDGDGHYRIFVITENKEIKKVAEFEGSDGNGYYGTGFWLAVKRPD